MTSLRIAYYLTVINARLWWQGGTWRQIYVAGGLYAAFFSLFIWQMAALLKVGTP